jgi:hypothetical protein
MGFWVSRKLSQDFDKYGLFCILNYTGDLTLCPHLNPAQSPVFIIGVFELIDVDKQDGKRLVIHPALHKSPAQERPKLIPPVSPPKPEAILSFSLSFE